MEKESQIEFENKCKVLLEPLNSKEELQNWIYVFFGIWFPDNVVYPESTHSPVSAMWRIYELLKTGESEEVPQVVMLSSRDSYKTLSAAAIEVLCMIHFRISVGHAAAILSQSEKSVQYCNAFFRSIRPYLEENGWKKASDNKTRIEWITDEEENIYLRILVMTRKGMNSEHLPMLVMDELDLIQDPGALDEAKLVPSVYKQYFPLTVGLSTRKYAGGIMESFMNETVKSGGEILRWNMIDVCERISHEKAQIDKPKIARYISRELPMSNLSIEGYDKLPESEKDKYERFEAYSGIAEHPMLSIMKNYLADRPQDDHGDLYKPLSSVHNNFKRTSPEWANAQLLCNKPSSSGLVYPRFSEDLNVLSVQQAWEKISGNETPCNFSMLKQYMLDLGIVFIGGGDWGWSDACSMPILALIPGGEIWYMANHTDTKMEIPDIIKVCSKLNIEWQVAKWYVDQNYPAYIKELRKAGLTVPKFKKVVEDGITALQAKIVDAENIRKFFIIDTPENRPVIEAFGVYSWKRNVNGDVIEGKPDHGTDGSADIMDALRYPFQNLFSKGNKPSFSVAGNESQDRQKRLVTNSSDLKEVAKNVNNDIMKQKIASLATQTPTSAKKTKNNKKILW